MNKIEFMVEFFKFQWLCIKQAWRGCWSLANEIGAVLGGLILAFALYCLRHWLEAHDWLEAPSSVPGTVLFTAILAAASVALAFLIIFVARFLFAPARLYWEQYKKAKSLETEIAAAKTAEEGSDHGPNWPIHEVFSYLEPDVLDRLQDNLWERAGDKIRDALSLGQLRIWGRPDKTKLGDWVGERAALRLIDPKYWETAFFTYLFFDSSAQKATHCYADRDTGRPAYTDLQVNRAEVLKLWPGEPDDLAEGYPNVRLADSPAVMALFDGPERAKIIALLTEEKLSSWARESATVAHDFVLLKGGVWVMSAFRCDPKTPADPGSINQTYLRRRHTQNSAFYDVCMNFAQLKRAWPALEIRRTKCDVL